MTPIALEQRQFEPCNIVYSAEMNTKDVERILASHAQLLSELKPQVEPKQSWQQSNPWLIQLLVSVVIIVLTTLVTRAFSSDDKNQELNIDARIEQKLKDHDFDGLKSTVDKTQEKVDGIKTTLDMLVAQNIKQSASLNSRDLKQQLPQLNNILEFAKSNHLPLDTATASGLYDKLKPLFSSGDSEAWRAALSLAAYSTLLRPPADVSNTQPIGDHTNHVLSIYEEPPSPAGEESPEISAITASVPKSMGAVMGPIGEDLNTDKDTSNPQVFLRNGAVILDGYHLKNITLIGVHVNYDGGSVVLDAVTFINCQFSVRNTEIGQKFIAQAIAVPPLRFRSS